MKLNFRRSAAVAVSASLIIAGTVAALPANAVVLYTMPDQSQTDGSSDTQPFAGWGDMNGGNASRPYVQNLSVINGANITNVVTNGSPTSAAPASGDLAAVVTPVNLCRHDQAPSPGQCYSTPNRVQITLGRQGNNVLNYDLRNPGNQTVNADSVIDMTIKLNTLGQSLRWSQAAGDLLYWQTSNLGTPDASVRIKFRPATEPAIDWSTVPTDSGCTATPIFNCDLAKADGEYLGASMLLSLDDTLDPALTGSVFATEGAISGFLVPGGSSANPVLDLQIASAHLKSNGDLNTGRMKAFLPAQALVNLYGVLPADAANIFTATRTGSAGTNAAPVSTAWSAAANGSDGLLIDINGITFSTPTYQVARKSATVNSSAKVSGKKTVVKVNKKFKACKAKGCKADVYKITSQLSGKTKKVGSAKIKYQKLDLKVKKSKLGKGSRYLIAIHKAGKKKPLVANSLGSVR